MAEIIVSHEGLSLLARRACLDVPDTGLVFFGVRGLLPLDVGGTPFAAEHRVRLTSIDHESMRCTLGQWRPATGDVAVFPGSTVPNRKAVQRARTTGGVGANMLMPGRYAYDRGVHKAGSPTGHRAFRQGMFFPVWRNVDDLDYDLADRLDTSGRTPDVYPWDNLHCAHHDDLDTPGFSSNGCQVIAGRPSMPSNGNRPETGPWKRFVSNAYADEAKGQTRFVYLLFSGTELGMIAARPAGPFSRSLRFGSNGDWVEKVQTALRLHGFPFLPVDGDFGRNTLEALMGFQAQAFGPGQADGVVGSNTAGALEIDWPPLEWTSGGRAGKAALTAAPVAVPGGAPLDWRASAVQITPGFEVSGDPYEGVSGDFDGMGVSCGALQWNIGKASLQPMVLVLPDARVKALMPTLGSEFLRACRASVPVGLAIVRGWQTKAKLSRAAAAELKALMGSPEMRAQQETRITAVADKAFAAAGRWAVAVGRPAPSKHEFLWFFDLTTQNGGLEGITADQVADFIHRNAAEGAGEVVCDFMAGLNGTSGHIRDAHKNASLWRGDLKPIALELLVLSYLRSGSASPKWRHVVLNRKGTIAAGRGWVNGSKYDLSHLIS